MKTTEEKTRKQARETLENLQPIEKLLFIEEGLRLLENDIFYNIETDADRETARKIQNAQRQLFKIYTAQAWK